ncbi:unnamed protein product [Linum tenue]|uniref:Bifunctional inhibitor/plant lipid transfer protein/seed storage helical domain-containing protein n=1 Tax=Linum tenue TaxID=586396 RepID=A0AAV0P5V1_9ROSI|nr:unnamed protein product [Linum tenue]
MASFKPTSLLLLISMVASLSLLTSPAHGQITTSCSSTAIAALAPCMSFLTNSSGTGSSPTAGCCDTLKNLTGTSLDCMCLVVTGSVPFQIPINRTLAISLPRACNMPGVPLQCKAAAGAPVPAPGSAPSLAPGISPSDTPTSSVVPETPSPESGTTTPDLTPPSSTTGSTPTINTSAAAASYSFSPSLVVLAVGFVLCKFY